MESSLFQQSAKTYRILVVDDSADNLFLVQSILEEEGYDITLATNGPASLVQVEQSPPDLVLLDVMMPEMDGLEVTKRIRENLNLPFIPILLITAHDEPSAVKGLDSGADDFIRKPVEVDELLARVRSLLRLKNSVDERDQITRQREDFVSRLTHDMRTPLVAADRMLSLFQQGALGDVPPNMLEAIEVMTRSNRNLLEMVNTMLEVYRYEAGRKQLHFSIIDLDKLIAEIVPELAPLAEEKSLELDYKIHQQYNPVEGDRLELHRVFTNLIGNAIKFTDSGSVKIELLTENKPEESNNWTVVKIKDTGSGISLEEQQTLFQRFRQGSHNRFGSGLGLHLSLRIIETHRGTIKVESELGKGSQFIVYLPSIC